MSQLRSEDGRWVQLVTGHQSSPVCKTVRLDLTIIKVLPSSHSLLLDLMILTSRALNSGLPETNLGSKENRGHVSSACSLPVMMSWADGASLPGLC